MFGGRGGGLWGGPFRRCGRAGVRASPSSRPDRSTFFLPGVSQGANLREFHVLAQFLKMLDGIFKMSGGRFKMSGGRFKMFGGRGGGCGRDRFGGACVRASPSSRPDRSTFLLPGVSQGVNF